MPSGRQDNAAGRGGPSPTAPAPGASSTSADPRSSRVVPAALSECVQLFDHELAATAAAHASIAQWKMHIDAINQLMAGQISRYQAQQRWSQTRRGAVHKVRAFEVLRQQLAGPRCPANSPSGRGLGACHLATSAYADVVQAARTTIHVWMMHIDQMENMPATAITSSQVRMWNHMWDLGQRRLGQYHHLLGQAQRHTCVAWPAARPSRPAEGTHTPAMRRLKMGSQQ